MVEASGFGQEVGVVIMDINDINELNTQGFTYITDLRVWRCDECRSLVQGLSTDLAIHLEWHNSLLLQSLDNVDSDR